MNSGTIVSLNKKTAIIFGAGFTGQVVYDRICNDYEVIAFCDNNVQKQQKTLFNLPVIDPSRLKEVEYDNIFIGTDMRDSVYRQVVDELGISADKLLDEPVKLLTYKARRIALKGASEIIKNRGLQGSTAEAGVFQGEFAKKINEFFNDRKLYLFDTFEGFHKEDVSLEEDKVNAFAGEFNINTNADFVLSVMPFKDNCIIKQGYFPESAVNIDDPFVFVSLDMDLYKPTLEGLKFFYPKLVKGGYIFIHDFFSQRFNGVKKAVEEYSLEVNLQYCPLGDECSIIITK